MGFSMFSSNSTPIAIDFGSSSVKLLQITQDESPSILAATEIEVPESVRLDPDALLPFYAKALPEALSRCRFKGKRVVMAVPSTQTFIQHMQLVNAPDMSRDDLIKAQLQSQMGCSPNSIVVRSVNVADVHRDGQARSEIICFAIARDTVMNFVNMLKRCKLNVVGIHTEAMAMVRAFDHLNRRATDHEVTTLYVDIGWAGTHVAISHGKKMVFARHIQIGGRHFDEHIARMLRCDTVTARSHRLSLGDQAIKANQPAPGEAREKSGAILSAAASAHAAGGNDAGGGAAVETAEERRSGDGPAANCHAVPEGKPPTRAANVDITEQLDTISDELSMCLRYHNGLFPNRNINRSIFVGGESRQTWLCQHIVQSLRLPAQLGDPLSRLVRHGKVTPNVDLSQPQPGWAVAYGLCFAPADL
ncbi:MAG: pilus assembly protein PilM [Planctomycetota bacterium]|jgi:type IV pilus assembly protein PilM